MRVIRVAEKVSILKDGFLNLERQRVVGCVALKKDVGARKFGSEFFKAEGCQRFRQCLRSDRLSQNVGKFGIVSRFEKRISICFEYLAVWTYANQNGPQTRLFFSVRGGLVDLTKKWCA